MTSPFPKSRFMDFLWRHRIRLLGAVACLAIINVAWVTLSYLIYPGYVDHGEPVVSILSWRLLEGISVNPGFDDPGRVTGLFGPYIYSIHALSFFLFGGSVAAGKVAGVAAAALIPVVAFLAHRQKGAAIALAAGILAVGFVLLNIPFSIWNRPEAFIALLATISVWAMNASRPGRVEWAASMVIAVSGGLAVGLKLHAGIYIAPVVLYHCFDKARGLKVFTAICIVGAAVAFLPFALPVFSLANYLSWFGPMAGKVTSPELALKVGRYALLYFAPVALFFTLWARESEEGPGRRESVYFGTYLAAVAVAIYIGSKPGAGIHYLFPFLAMTTDLILRHARRCRRRIFAWALVGVLAVAVLAIGVPVQKRFLGALHWREASQITAELRRIMAEFPDRTIEMGLGQDVATYRSTFYKPLLVMAGHPYTLNPVFVEETAVMLKMPLPDAMLAMIRGCSTDIWLIPKGERPFTMVGYYGRRIFDDAFLGDFNAAYARTRSFEYYDVWSCKR